MIRFLIRTEVILLIILVSVVITEPYSKLLLSSLAFALNTCALVIFTVRYLATLGDSNIRDAEKTYQKGMALWRMLVIFSLQTLISIFEINKVPIDRRIASSLFLLNVLFTVAIYFCFFLYSINRKEECRP